MKHNKDSNRSAREADVKPDRMPSRILWWIAVGGAIAIASVVVISFCHPNMSERVKFGATAVLSVLALVVISFQLVIYREQWEAMWEQRDTMSDQLSVMRASEETLKRQASAFDAQVAAMQQALSQQADHMETTRQQTNQIILQNQESIAIAEKNMMYAQRAYLAIWQPSIEIVGGTRFFLLKVKNFGHTPASKVEIFLMAELRDSLPDMSPEAIDSDEWHQLGLISPGDYVDEVTNEIRPTPEQFAVSISSSQPFVGLDLYCWGAIRWEDIFGKCHETTFSMSQNRQDPYRVRPCPTDNPTN